MNSKRRAVAICLLASLCVWYGAGITNGSIILIAAIFSLYYYIKILPILLIIILGFGLYSLLTSSLISLKYAFLVSVFSILFMVLGYVFENYVLNPFKKHQRTHRHVFVSFEQNSIPQCFVDMEFNEIPQTFDHVKKRYRTLAKIHHPDANGDKHAFIQLNDAYNLCKKHYEKSQG